MKKIILSLLGFCFTFATMAEPIGKQTALYTAQAYMLAKGKNINASQTPFRAIRKGATQTNENEDAYYYVFNAGNNGGYVIISGDDRTEPILGYVEQGSFDPNNIPENMRSWLQLYADQIKFIIDNDIQPGSPLLKTRNKIKGTKHSVGEMLTTRWNQGSPYNILCPKYYKEEDGTRHFPATGCTATAMAQVLYFYKYPEKTKNIIPAHSNTYTYTDKEDGQRKSATVSVPAIPKNTIIDWDNMRDTYSWQDEAHANAQDTAVAQLMLYCGQAVKMGWGPSSGANFSAEAYIKYFGYDNSCYVGERRDYSIDDWFDMLYNEIEQGYPVLFSGFSSGGGHAFVLDGFDGENLFHLNWGWGGGSNGWFLVSILNPGDNSGIGASSSSDGYSMSQRALFNLRLPDNTNADTYLFIKDVSVVNSTSIKATFENRTGASGSFNTAIVKQDDDGGLSVVGTMQTITGMAADASQTKTFSIKNRLPEGTYRLSPASKPTRSQVWRPKYNLQNHYIEAVVDTAGTVVLTPVDINNGNSISIDTIVFPGSRVVEKEQEVKVTFRNNGDEYFKTIYMHASKTASAPSNSTYADSKSQVVVRRGETVDVSYFFKPEETGTYKLWFCTGSDGSGQIGTGTMEVITESEAEKASLSVVSYTITNLVNGTAYGNHLVGKASIKNNARVEFNGMIRLTIWRQPNASGSAYGGSSSSYEVNILAGKSVSVEFDFDNLKEGDKYYLSASFVNANGTFSNSGVWDLGGWVMGNGIATWKNDGTIAGKAYASSISITASMCGVYADCSRKINRMTPNKNPNTIYAFGADRTIPASLDNSNTVSGSHADRINLVNDEPYYLPATFDADSATFTYTFPEVEPNDTTGWKAFTMPFEADSIFVDEIPVSLEDSLNHFWIYEFSAEGDEGEVIFTPAKKLRGGTPYIIAGDAKMAGHSIVFRATNVPFFKSGTDKMVVTSPSYKFHGNTYSPKVNNCYILNEAGTAFEYVTKTTALNAMASYFTTNLGDEERPDSILLPAIPASPERNITLDETSSEEIAYGIYDNLTLKRTFEAGWNTLCLPFEVKDVEAIFGEGSKAYEVLGLVEGELDCCLVDSLAPSQPYIIYLPEAITEDQILSDITINVASTNAGFVQKYGVHMIGKYNPVTSDMFSMELRKLNADGTFTKFGPEEVMNGFRALFSIPSDEEVSLHLYDDPTGITSLKATTERKSIYNLAGQRLNKAGKGINIIDGKKVLR